MENSTDKAAPISVEIAGLLKETGNMEPLNKHITKDSKELSSPLVFEDKISDCSLLVDTKEHYDHTTATFLENQTASFPVMKIEPECDYYPTKNIPSTDFIYQQNKTEGSEYMSEQLMTSVKTEDNLTESKIEKWPELVVGDFKVKNEEVDQREEDLFENEIRFKDCGSQQIEIIKTENSKIKSENEKWPKIVHDEWKIKHEEVDLKEEGLLESGFKDGNSTYEEKLKLKKGGRPLPDIKIETAGVSRGKPYTRHFNRDIYLRNDWICGCNKKNALFCFPCVLFKGDKTWSQKGVRDLVHLKEKVNKHENSRSHIHNAMEYAILGTGNISAQLDTTYWRNIQVHNDNVKRNRFVLSKIISSIKFCSAFELALKGYDEIVTSTNPGIFRRINFSAELDATLSKHLGKASVFEGCSKELQNDLLDCMLEVIHEEIVKEINDAFYLAVIADETIDVSARSQLAIVLRYTINGEPIERFWTYLPLAKCDAETISLNILSVLDPLIERTPSKLIAQSYDGVVAMSGQHAGVQAKIKEKYPFAHFVNCYAHQLNLVMYKAASINSQARVFFVNLEEIPAFFNNYPQFVEVLNKVVGEKRTRWNFNIQTVNAVYENQDTLLQCMEEIQQTFTNAAICSAAASSIHRMLQDPVFGFWLTYFHQVLPHVDILSNQLQKSETNLTEVKNAIDIFEKNITSTIYKIDEIISEYKKKRPNNSLFDHHDAAREICDAILISVKERFVFTDHIQAASLFIFECFAKDCTQFPDEQLNATSLAYPAIDKKRLKTELSVIYSRKDCRGLNGILPLLKFLIHNNLQNTLKETKNILDILITTPMSTPEAERCFSTLKRIKTFLLNSMTQDRLTALGMLSIEREFVSKITDFNERVIDKFASRKDRRIDLLLKK